MLSVYDLYDLSEIFKSIRAFPRYELNNELVIRVLRVLKNRYNNHEANQFRVALRSIDLLDRKMFYYVYVDNVYVYYPPLLKDEYIYGILTECCEYLLRVLERNCFVEAEDLADCLHNLPTQIATNNLSIPNGFWENEVKAFREKWDNRFLSMFHNAK